MTLFGCGFCRRVFVKSHSFQISVLLPSPTHFRRQRDHDCSFSNYMEGRNHRIHVDGFFTLLMCEDLAIGWSWLMSRFFRYVEILKNRTSTTSYVEAWLATPSQITLPPMSDLGCDTFGASSSLLGSRLWEIEVLQVKLSETVEATTPKRQRNIGNPRKIFCLGKIWLESWLRTMGKRMMLN